MRHPARSSVLMTLFLIATLNLLVSLAFGTNITLAILFFLPIGAVIAVSVLAEVLWLREQHRNK